MNSKSRFGYSLRVLLLAGGLLLSGCATTDAEFADPRDPLEGFNRAMFSLNDMLDRALFKPLAQGYQFIVPAPVDKGVTNFFNNLGDVTTAINNLLQLKVGRAANDLGRVVVNSTLGIGGLFDVASNMDLPRHDEDFGQTLGTWGVASGPYLVLPIIGSSSGRDAVGVVVDWFTDPLTYLEDDTLRWSLRGLDFVDTRADLLSASRVVDEAALDPYAFVRDAYLQRRRNLVYDGNPPPEEEDF
ncbi:MAG: VacJ family lipoprotein [Gammaproteobacteria bacterium]|nr:MAG: VacJ family lipoprotein [Gammaproteobacteria bacterium]